MNSDVHESPKIWGQYNTNVLISNVKTQKLVSSRWEEGLREVSNRCNWLKIKFGQKQTSQTNDEAQNERIRRIAKGNPNRKMVIIQVPKYGGVVTGRYMTLKSMKWI